jgi:hypothetical protein
MNLDDPGAKADMELLVVIFLMSVSAIAIALGRWPVALGLALILTATLIRYGRRP